MAASPSSVITLGFGFGVELLPTLGYGVGAEVVVTARAAEFRILHGTDSGFRRVSGTESGFVRINGTDSAEIFK